MVKSKLFDPDTFGPVVAALTMKKLADIASELDGWSPTIAETEGLPPFYGLHNVTARAIPDDLEWLQICLLPTDDVRYLVVPYILRPEKPKQTQHNSGLFTATVDSWTHWEFIPHPDVNAEDISTPFNSIDEAADRVREFCQTLG